MKLIPLLALFIAGYLIFRMFKSTGSDSPTEQLPQRKEAGNMVRCERCGLNIPENEALWEDGKPYCSEEHRDG